MLRSRGQSSDEGEAEPVTSLARPLLILMLAVACLAGAIYSAVRGGLVGRRLSPQTALATVLPDSEQARAVCGATPAAANAHSFVIAYGPELQGFIELLTAQFLRLCPDFEIKHAVGDDLQTAAALAKGGQPATLWVTGSELALSLAGLPGAAPSPSSAAATVLFRSPQVLVAWEDRAQVLQQLLQSGYSQEGTWMQAGCALVPREAAADASAGRGSWSGWYAAAFPPAEAPAKKRRHRAPVPEATPLAYDLNLWGRVKLLHSSPARSAQGLGALYMLAYDYLLPPAVRAAAAPGAPAFAQALARDSMQLEQWLKRCEGADGPPPESTQLGVSRFRERGPAGADFIVLPEHLALSLVAQFDAHGKWPQGPRIIYPESGLRNEYRAVFSATATPEQQEAAHRWLAFALSDASQRQAIEQGLRPGRSDIGIRDYDVPANLFLKLRHYGAAVEPRQHNPPILGPAEVQALQRLWEDATGMN